MISEENKNKLDSIIKSRGIKNIRGVLKTKIKIAVPLEMLFKSFYSTRNIPFIKFNPGKKLEKIYRFFTDNYVSVTGKKIPILYYENKNIKKEIMGVNKIIAYKNSLGFYIKIDEASIVCNLYNNGHIEFLGLKQAMSYIEVENILNRTLNDMLIATINKIIYKIGVKLDNFDSLFSLYVNIVEINYNVDIRVKGIIV